MPIEPLITRLVQEAPVLDDQVVGELITELRTNGSPLARSIARIVELVAEQLVDAGVALPALAMACATLESSVDGVVLEAARYEIETLTPMPDGHRGEPLRPVVLIPTTQLKRR